MFLLKEIALSRIPIQVHPHIPGANALVVLPLGKPPKKLGFWVKVNQQGHCIL